MINGRYALEIILEACQDGDMGRKRTRLELSAGERAELRRRLGSATHPRDQERLRTVLDATSGRHTLEELAERVGRVRATIQLWLGRFARGGVEGLLARDTPPGSISPIANPKIQTQLRAGWRTGRWQSASQVAAWLQKAHGIKRARKSIYYWLEKGGRGGKRDRSRATRR